MSQTIFVTSRDFIDLDQTFVKHPSTKNVGVKKNISAVKQSVLNLMQLRQGDVPFHPEIKSPVYDFFFDNFTAVSKVVLESEVKKYLNVYEPRLSITDVYVDITSPNAISCMIEGSIVNVSTPVVINVLIERQR